LASLRTSRATQLWLETSDVELLRVRGRWSNARSLESYLQELGTVTFLSRLSADSRSRVQDLAAISAAVLEEVQVLLAQEVPMQSWFEHFRSAGFV